MVDMMNTATISSNENAVNAVIPVCLKISVQTIARTKLTPFAYASFSKSTVLEYLKTPAYVLKIFAPAQLSKAKNNAVYNTA